MAKMKTALALLILVLACGLLPAQSITNVRVEQDPTLRYYKVTFDLSGKADEIYQIKVVPYKGERNLSNLRYLSGQGVSQPCAPGKDLQIFWAADLEGFETEGWQFRLSAIPLLENMVYVDHGTFQMGLNDGDSDEKSVHNVAVSSLAQVHLWWVNSSILSVIPAQAGIQVFCRVRSAACQCCVLAFRRIGILRHGAFLDPSLRWDDGTDVPFIHTHSI